MSFKKLTILHLIFTLILGVALGVALLLDANEQTNKVLTIPGGILLLAIGYGGPVITGLACLWLINKRWRVSYTPYLVAYYVFVAALIVTLWSTSNQTDSGFGILLLPWLPLPAILFTIMYAFIMKRKQKRIFLMLLALSLAICACVWYMAKPKEHSTVEITEINALLGEANIHKLNGWATYPNCGETAGGDRFSESYYLQVNNVEVTYQETESLKSFAKSKNYEVSPRDDGYTVKKGDSWYIIVLTENRPYPAIFASIKSDEKPAGFPVGGTVCN